MRGKGEQGGQGAGVCVHPTSFGWETPAVSLLLRIKEFGKTVTLILIFKAVSYC
jgi:hypothetical protein